MKKVCFLLGTGLVSLLVGCASTPVALAPVGSDPAGIENTAAKGGLLVFSSLVGRSEGDNPTWYQHSDCRLFIAPCFTSLRNWRLQTSNRKLDLARSFLS